MLGVKTSLDTSRDNKDIINMYNIISRKLRKNLKIKI